ncbi:MAG: TPM domain-containing protein, partial [Oscillospiraceae bacterium]|nr:TPM domain-containing protein [Oscillospiraceae bacterium]
MKLSTNRVVGIIAVVLAIVAAVVLGQMRKDHFLSKSPTELLEVEYRQWICDEAKLLDDATVKTVEKYNAAWDEKYYAVVAVASVERMVGWDETDYAAALGQKWGLGENDMILVLVEDGDWQVYMGDYVGAMMQDYQQQKLRQALDDAYYDGDFDGAVTAFFRQCDVFYGQIDPAHKSGAYYGGDWYAPVEHGKEAGGGIVGVIFLILAIFVV